MTETPTPPKHAGGNFRWVICALLFFSVAVNYIDRLTLGILKPLLSDELGWTDLDYGYITAAFSFAYAFGYLFGGWAMDRMGVKRGLPLFVIVWSLAAMAHGLCSYFDVTKQFHLPWFEWAEDGFKVATLIMPMTVAGFMFARILLGLSEGANFPAAIKIVAEWFPLKERALSTGLFNAGTTVGSVICPIMVPWVYLHLGWATTFYITGGTGLIWVIAWWFIYDHPETHKHLSDEERHYIREGQPLVEVKKVKVPWITLLGYRAVWAYVIAGILAAPAWGFYQSFLPDFISKKFSAPKLEAVDVPDAAAFASQLTQTNNRVSLYLRSQFSPETQALLASHAASSGGDTNVSAALVEGLNKLILAPTMFETNAFSGVTLRPETVDLLAKPVTNTNMIARINRMLLEDAYPNGISRMMTLQVIGWWTGAFFALATIGGILGGWLAGHLLNLGWSLNAARKFTFLICALAVVPVFLAPMASTAFLAVLIVGIAGSAHQGWSANLFTFVSDTMPKETIGSVVGLGGFVGYFTGGFVNALTGLIVQKTGSYVWVFAYFSGTYVVSLLAMQLLVPRIGKVQAK